MTDRCTCHTHAGLAPGRHMPYMTVGDVARRLTERLEDAEARIAELEAENTRLRTSFEDAKALMNKAYDRAAELEATVERRTELGNAMGEAIIDLTLTNEVSAPLMRPLWNAHDVWREEVSYE